jgi:hypothetical protein
LITGHHKKAVVMKMRKKDSTFAVKTEAKNAKVLFDHFWKAINGKELLSYHPTIIQEIDLHPINTALNAPPTLTEIKAALQKMQFKKSPAGKNRILTDSFKSLKRQGPLSAFMKLITLFWKINQFNPADW